MHPQGLSIWFFIGINLAVSGALILGAGVYELFYPPEHPVVLFHLHASIWWGAFLLAVGLFYCIRFAPQRKHLKKSLATDTKETAWRS